MSGAARARAGERRARAAVPTRLRAIDAGGRCAVGPAGQCADVILEHGRFVARCLARGCAWRSHPAQHLSAAIYEYAGHAGPVL